MAKQLIFNIVCREVYIKSGLNINSIMYLFKHIPHITLGEDAERSLRGWVEGHFGRNKKIISCTIKSCIIAID